MKLELVFAELHTPLFLGGTNYGQKLSCEMGTKGKLKLAYDRENQELLVEAKGLVAIIPTSNVVSMTPLDVKAKPAAKPENKHPTHVLGAALTAQVETPMAHVHAGPGRGKKNA